MSDDLGLKWYVAVIVARAKIVGEWADDYLIDHQVRLLRAPDAETAYSIALELGAAEAHSYKNGDGAVVAWEFCGLADLDEVRAPELESGVEVYSWQVPGQPDDAVLPKEKLAVFWRAANGHHPARDLLG
jgi:hypothetical protein